MSSPSSKEKHHGNNLASKMKTPTKLTENNKSNIKTPLSKSSANNPPKRKVTPKKEKVKEPEVNDKDLEEESSEESSEESYSSSGSSSSSASQGDGSSSGM